MMYLMPDSQLHVLLQAKLELEWNLIANPHILIMFSTGVRAPILHVVTVGFLNCVFTINLLLDSYQNNYFSSRLSEPYSDRQVPEKWPKFSHIIKQINSSSVSVSSAVRSVKLSIVFVFFAFHSVGTILRLFRRAYQLTSYLS